MLKLFVVDDEKIIREGILNCLNWSDYGIRVIGDARNGAEALEVLKDEKPDIILTDVRMPVMDGIELSRKLIEMYRDVKIIFISGYADIEYIKTALKIAAEDYILKPVDVDELEKAIVKAADCCKRENATRDYRLMLEQKLLQSMPSLREKFLKLLVNGDIKDKKEIADRFGFLDIHIPLDIFYAVFIISIDDYKEKSENLSQLDKQLNSFSIINIVQETIEIHGKGYVFEWKDEEFVCITGLPIDETLIEDYIDTVSSSIHKNLNDYLNFSNTIGIGLWVESIEKLSTSYKYARNAVNQKFVMGKNRIIYVNKLDDGREDSKKYDEFVMGFLQSVQEHDSKHTLSLIDEAYSNIKKSKNIDIKRTKSMSLQIVSVISGYAQQWDKNYDSKNLSIVHISEQLLQKETIDEIHEYLKGYMNSIFSSLKSTNESEAVNVVQEIKNIITGRYGEDLSINSIAREVYLTPAYICMLFKQDTGITINEYLTSVRIEKAKEYLRLGRYKMFEIASLVGYGDHKYFSKLFKKHTGVNPSEFL